MSDIDDDDIYPYGDRTPEDTRRRRDQLVAETDWLVRRHRDQMDAGDAPTLSPEQYASLLAYRQALRDVPLQPGFPDVEWPARPVLV